LAKRYADAGLQAAAEVITRTERDGFGFAQARLRGRFLDPADFRSLTALPDLRRLAGAEGLKAFAVADQAEQESTYHNQHATIAHGRTATCGVTLNNVHPFRHKGWTLAHNGVVTWNGDNSHEHKNASCDSQHLLYCLTEHPNDEDKQKDALLEISGYAAFMAISPTGRLIVAVDATARLYAGITNKKRWIFGTTPEIVEAIADAWKCRNVEAFKIHPWSWISFPASGAMPGISKWKHAEATRRELAFSSKSLGMGVTEHSYRETIRRDDAVGQGYWQNGVFYPSGSTPARQRPYVPIGARGDEPLTQHNLDDEDRRVRDFTQMDELFDDEDSGIPSYVPASAAAQVEVAE
jgi:hypothetical protein